MAGVGWKFPRKPRVFSVSIMKGCWTSGAVSVRLLRRCRGCVSCLCCGQLLRWVSPECCVRVLSHSLSLCSVLCMLLNSICLCFVGEYCGSVYKSYWSSFLVLNKLLNVVIMVAVVQFFFLM